MKSALFVLVMLSPVACLAQLAGDWTGVATDSQGAHHIVLHITGPFTAMKASADMIDDKLTKSPVEPITFADTTLQFRIPANGAQYSGILNDNGQIVGTFTQRGAEAPLVLARLAVPRVPPDIRSEGSVAVENGHLLHKPTGLELQLPSGWTFDHTQFSSGGPGESILMNDANGKATVISVWVVRTQKFDPDTVSKALDAALPHLMAMRAGQVGAPRQAAPNYKIRDGSVQHTEIGGHSAVRAIGEFTRGKKDFAELVAWIFTDQTRTYFFARSAADNLQAIQAPFDEMLQSARIP